MFFSTTRKHVRGYPEIPVLSSDDILNELVKMRAMRGQVKTTKINKKTSLESAVVDLVQVMDQTLGLADNMSKFHQKLNKIDEVKILEQHSDNVSSFTNEPTKIESYQSPFNAISYMLPTFHCQSSNSFPDSPQQTINSSPPRNISSLSPPSPIISLYNPSFLHQSQSQSPLRTPSSQIHFKTLLSPSGSRSAQISEIDMALNAVVYDMGLMETFAKERQWLLQEKEEEIERIEAELKKDSLQLEIIHQDIAQVEYPIQNDKQNLTLQLQQHNHHSQFVLETPNIESSLHPLFSSQFPTQINSSLNQHSSSNSQLNKTKSYSLIHSPYSNDSNIHSISLPFHSQQPQFQHSSSSPHLTNQTFIQLKDSNQNIIDLKEEKTNNKQFDKIGQNEYPLNSALNQMNIPDSTTISQIQTEFIQHQSNSNLFPTFHSFHNLRLKQINSPFFTEEPLKYSIISTSNYKSNENIINKQEIGNEKVNQDQIETLIEQQEQITQYKIQETQQEIETQKDIIIKHQQEQQVIENVNHDEIGKELGETTQNQTIEDNQIMKDNQIIKDKQQLIVIDKQNKSVQENEIALNFKQEENSIQIIQSNLKNDINIDKDIVEEKGQDENYNQNQMNEIKDEIKKSFELENKFEYQNENEKEQINEKEKQNENEQNQEKENELINDNNKNNAIRNEQNNYQNEQQNEQQNEEINKNKEKEEHKKNKRKKHNKSIHFNIEKQQENKIYEIAQQDDQLEKDQTNQLLEEPSTLTSSSSQTYSYSQSNNNNSNILNYNEMNKSSFQPSFNFQPNLQIISVPSYQPSNHKSPNNRLIQPRPHHHKNQLKKFEELKQQENEQSKQQILIQQQRYYNEYEDQNETNNESNQNEIYSLNMRQTPELLPFNSKPSLVFNSPSIQNITSLFNFSFDDIKKKKDQEQTNIEYKNEQQQQQQQQQQLNNENNNQNMKIQEQTFNSQNKIIYDIPPLYTDYLTNYNQLENKQNNNNKEQTQSRVIIEEDQQQQISQLKENDEQEQENKQQQQTKINNKNKFIDLDQIENQIMKNRNSESQVSLTLSESDQQSNASIPTQSTSQQKRKEHLSKFEIQLKHPFERNSSPISLNQSFGSQSSFLVHNSSNRRNSFSNNQQDSFSPFVTTQIYSQQEIFPSATNIIKKKQSPLDRFNIKLNGMEILDSVSTKIRQVNVRPKSVKRKKEMDSIYDDTHRISISPCLPLFNNSKSTLNSQTMMNTAHPPMIVL